MVRVALVIAVIAVAVVALKQRSEEATPVAAMPRVDAAQVPKEFRSLLANRPDPARLLRERGALPGLGAVIRLASGGDDDEADAAIRPFADVGDPRELKRVRADIRRGFAALNRLSRNGGASAREVERTLARVYSAPVLAALGAEGRRAFAERYAGRTAVAQRVKVLDYEGIFVSGTRALAQVVYALSVRAPSGHFVARAPSTWTVRLAREGGRWRFVRGIES